MKTNSITRYLQRAILGTALLLSFTAFGAVTSSQLGTMLLRGNFTRVSQEYDVYYSRGPTSSSTYGGYHPGIDYSASYQAVYSPVSGTISSVDPYTWGRVSVRIDGTSDYFILMHMSSISVRAGERVAVGTQLGVSGSVGADAPHLHVEVRTGTDTAAWYFRSSTSTGVNKNPASVVNYVAPLSPPSGMYVSNLTGSRVDFAWLSASNATGYRIHVSTSYGGWSATTGWDASDSRIANYFLPVNAGTSSSSYAWYSGNGSYAGPRPGVTYYWSVRLNTASQGASAFSSPQAFTVPASISNPMLSISTTNISRSVTQYGSPSASSFTVRNSGSGILNYSASSNVSWLSISPSSGDSQGETDTLNVNFSANASYSSPTTLYGTITVSGGSAGTQYISVALTITSTPVVNSDDHGNYTWNASTLTRYGNVGGNIEQVNDEDMFRVVVNSWGTVSFYTTGSTDTMGYLLDGNGNQLTWNDDANGSTNFYLSAYLSPGTYYLKVRGFSSRTGAYRVYAN